MTTRSQFNGQLTGRQIHCTETPFVIKTLKETGPPLPRTILETSDVGSLINSRGKLHVSKLMSFNFPYTPKPLFILSVIYHCL